MPATSHVSELFGGILPFFHVAEAKSFRVAAERLGVTTAATSKAVAKLEGELGVVLLNRTSRRVALTPEGALFFERCREAIAQLQAGRELLAEAQSVPQGTLHVAAPHIVANHIVPSLPRLLGRHPRLVVKVSVSDRMARLVEEEVDVAVRLGALGDSTLVARPLRTPRFVTVAAPAYLGRHGTPQTLADLSSHNCLCYVTTRGTVRGWVFADDGREVEVAPRGNFIVDHGEQVLHAALAGLGIAQIFDFMAARHLAEGRLVEVLADHSVEGVPMHAVCLPRRQRSPKVRAFIDFIVELLGARVAPERIVRQSG